MIMIIMNRAANNGNDYLIQELCKHGLTVKDLEKRDEFGSTPLHFAALQNNENVVQLLVIDFAI